MTSLAALRSRRLQPRHDWVRPTERQQAIFRLLSDGASYNEAAAATGLSARTLRRELDALMRVNGLGNVGAFATGVFCESLGRA